MAEPITGHEYLMLLKKQGEKKAEYFETLYNELDRKAREKGIPLNGQFELTPLCNFDCKMCYTHLTKDQMRGKPLLTVEQWKQIIDEAYSAGMVRVNLTGGECLSYPGFRELYLYLHSLGCEIRVLTNGTLLDDIWISFFKDHPPILIQISLYGGDEETYERVTGQRMYSIVSANIRKVIESGLPVGLAITPSKYMGDGLLNTIQAAHSFGIPYSITPDLIDPQKETGRSGLDHELSLDDYVSVYRLRNELFGNPLPSINIDQLPQPGGPNHECIMFGLNCGGGMSCFDIDWTGAMHICNSFHSVAFHPLTEGFMSCWEKLHRIAADWPRVPECIDCPYEPVCTNCEVRKARFGKPGQQPLALCERTRYLVQHGIYKIQECT